MPLDLVGKLHRTVYVAQCVEDAREDFVQLLMQKCGAVDGWDVLDNRIVVVFQSMNSVSTALTFSGMSFVDLTSKIVVWKATEAPPAALISQQLSIAGRDLEKEEAERQTRRAIRLQRRAAFQAALGDDLDVSDYTKPEMREQQLKGLCYRQLKALCIITADVLAQKEMELEFKKKNLAVTRSVVAMGGKRTRE